MALTFTGQRNLYGKLTNNESTDNLTLGDTLTNSETRRLVAKIGGNLLHKTAQATTVVNQATYDLPNDLKKLRAITVTSGSTIYPVKRAVNRDHWDSLNSAVATAYTDEFPVWFYIIGRDVSFWPTLSTGTATITYDYDKRFIDLSVANFTVGSVGTATTGSATVYGNASGSTTAWTDSMQGRFLQIAKSNNANSGDGDWYEIASVSNATTLVLERNYQGQNITAGTAVYIIGEISPLPDGFHELPVYRATQFYWSKNDQNRAVLFKNMADQLESELFAANDPTEHVVVEDAEVLGVENPNLYPRSIG